MKVKVEDVVSYLPKFGTLSMSGLAGIKHSTTIPHRSAPNENALSPLKKMSNFPSVVNSVPMEILQYRLSYPKHYACFATRANVFVYTWVQDDHTRRFMLWVPTYFRQISYFLYHLLVSISHSVVSVIN